MRDMFIQAPSSNLCSVSSGVHVYSKKRKADHLDNSIGSTCWTLNSNVQTASELSPVKTQPYLQTHTIKLLDNYQRTGQKVKLQINILIYKYINDYVS